MISVIIPAFNEEKTIGKVIDSINVAMRHVRQKHEIIVIDDGSSDRTRDIANGRKAKVIAHPYNMGYGASIKTGIRSASDDWILIMDADGTYPADEIPALLKHTPEYDMVVGARTGKNVKVQFYRKPAKWLLTRLASYLAGKRIPDLNSGMRLFRKSDMSRFSGILPSGFSFTTTSTLAYLCNDLTIKYLPIDYYKREGKSKIRPLHDGFNFMLLIFRTITYFSPMKIFMPIAVLLFLIGLVFLSYQIAFIHDLGQAPIIFILSSLQIGFLGLLADIISRKGAN